MGKEKEDASSKGNPLRRHDSLDIESTHLKGHNSHSHHHGVDKDSNWKVVIVLAFQSIGVVYGDLGTSPLYVFDTVFSGKITHRQDVIGALSIIYYTITLLTLVKYVLIVLRAHDNGNGGTFALYSLLCRHAKIGLLPNRQPEDQEVSNYKLELPSKHLGWTSMVKSGLENSKGAKFFLLIFTMLATSLVIGDGVLTPCISVLSAVGGLKGPEKLKHIFNDDNVVWIAVVILIVLFGFQSFGTDIVGYAFSPVLLLWFAFITCIGLYNFIKYDLTVVKAVNPWEIVQYFRRNGMDAWISLGGTAMCITGAEALFADLGHFSVRSIQLSTCCIVYPAVIIAYTGQAAYLHTMHSLEFNSAFYDSVPHDMYWPMFVIAVLASIIASQALISGTFSIIQQSLSLGCFPRVRVVHTSDKFEGQVYIPEFNYILMICCVLVTIGFKTTDKIGNAYGIAVVCVLFITSMFMVLVMIVIWKTNIFLILLYMSTIMFMELIYRAPSCISSPRRLPPLGLRAVLMLIMFIWNFVYRKKYYYEMENKVSSETVKEIVTKRAFRDYQGWQSFIRSLCMGSPNFRALCGECPCFAHGGGVCVCEISAVSKVPLDERFLFRRVYPRDLYVFRCVARYGYMEVQDEQESIEGVLVERLKEFIREDMLMHGHKKHHLHSDDDDESSQTSEGKDSFGTTRVKEEEIEREIEVINKACRAGIVHMMGESEVMSIKGSNLGRRFVIDFGYNFLKRVLRQSDKLFDIPHKRLLKVGMVYEL